MTLRVLRIYDKKEDVVVGMVAGKKNKKIKVYRY